MCLVQAITLLPLREGRLLVSCCWLESSRWAAIAHAGTEDAWQRSDLSIWAPRSGKCSKPLPSQPPPAGSSACLQIPAQLSLELPPGHNHRALLSQLLAPSSSTSPASTCPLLLRLSCSVPPYKEARPGIGNQQSHPRCPAHLFWWHEPQFRGFPALYLTTKPPCLCSHLTSCFP